MESRPSNPEHSSASPERERSSPFSGKAPDLGLKKHKILVVDDEPRIVELLRRELGRIYKVFTATRGVQALQIMEKESIVLIISDQKMPGMNGTELLERIVEHDPNTVRILLTGYTDLDALVDAINCGHIYRYVSKPWETEELKAVVKQGVEHYELKEQNRRLLEDLKKNNLELLRAYKDLQVLDKAKDTFISSISHELLTPLTSIRSFSEILLKYDNTNPREQKDFLGIIHSESERLMMLIEDVLDFSKFQTGAMAWNDIYFSLETEIHQIVETKKVRLQEKNLKIFLECPSNLPELFADRSRIRQVVINLLDNAIKFSVQGGEITARVELFQGRRFAESSEWVRVSVSDQGVGIKESDQFGIFDKFNQGSGDALTDKPQGTGLGLPICKEIVAHYGGKMWVESKEGKGSTFFFTIPLNPDGTAKPRKQPPAKSG